MLIKKKYYEDSKTEKAWYKSSMFVYTEMIEDEMENKGNLYVTFNNGTTYLYKDVKFEDYIMIIAGGLDGSHGKALNKYIKPKYEVEKQSNRSLVDIQKELDDLIEMEKNSTKYCTYFISGHKDITEEEFSYFYKPVLDSITQFDNTDDDVEPSDYYFVVGDCDGCDIMSQNYLIDVIGINPDKITVYIIGDTPVNINPKIKNIKSGFKSNEERDSQMTEDSSRDIAFVRDYNKLTGTAKNLLRRKLMK